MHTFGGNSSFGLDDLNAGLIASKSFFLGKKGLFEYLYNVILAFENTDCDNSYSKSSKSHEYSNKYENY